MLHTTKIKQHDNVRKKISGDRIGTGTNFDGSGKAGYVKFLSDRVRPGIKKLIETGSDRVAKTAYPPSTKTHIHSLLYIDWRDGLTIMRVLLRAKEQRKWIFAHPKKPTGF